MKETESVLAEVYGWLLVGYGLILTPHPLKECFQILKMPLNGKVETLQKGTLFLYSYFDEGRKKLRCWVVLTTNLVEKDIVICDPTERRVARLPNEAFALVESAKKAMYGGF